MILLRFSETLRWGGCWGNMEYPADCRKAGYLGGGLARHGEMQIVRHSHGEDDLGALQTDSQASALNNVK